jgi:glycosyltransferase involved in cell wall biosynthesis
MDIPLIHNGIDMDLWPTNSPRSGEYLLWSARINEEKNVAAAIRVAKHMQMPLKIAGRIADQRYFDEQVKPHLNDQIQYVGHVTQRELSNLAKKASAFLATATWQEPFGLAALEMLASGIPVVGFTTAVPPDWEHETVLTTTSLNWEDLIELVSGSNAVSPTACKAFASTMSIQHMTSNYIRLYSEALLQEGIEEEITCEEERVLQLVPQQSQTLKQR